MAAWVCLVIGVVLMLLSILRAFPRREKSRVNVRREKGTKPARKRVAIRPTIPVDEIDAYWGSAMPEGVRIQDTMPEIIKEGSPVAERRRSERTLNLASISSLDEFEPAAIPMPRTKVLGDSARTLGIHYFQYLLDNHSLPRGSVSLTNESNIIIAQNALKNRMQSLTLSHSAVAQRIGEQALCIFEPLESPVANIDRAIEALTPIFKDKNTFFIVENTENASSECLRHIPLICRHFHIPETNIFIKQANGNYINYVEDVNDFVPERIDVWQMPAVFFSSLLDYAQSSFDEGDTETVLRTLAPLLSGLCQRVYYRNNFPKVLLAQALNLTGMTNKALQHDVEAIACFEAALQLLREAEDYEAIKSVEANLGITMCTQEGATFHSLQIAARHLENVIELDKKDQEALTFLGHTYLRLFKLTDKPSFLTRAQRTYALAATLAPSPELEQIMESLPVRKSTSNFAKNSIASKR